MTRSRRRLLLLLVAASLAVVAALELGRRWAIDYVKSEVDARLTAFNHGPVTVARHVVRLRPAGIQVTLHRVGFLQRSPRRPAWLTVETIEFTLASADLFAGRTDPRRVDLDHLRTQLELGRAGQLATDLPFGKGVVRLPADRLVIRSASFAVRQPGRDRLVADRVVLTADQLGETLAVSGTIGEFLGGPWSLDLKFDGNTLATSASLNSTAVAVDSEQLARLPLAPPALRETLRIGGTTAVSVAVTRPPAGRLAYRISLTAAGMAIDWPQIDLALRNVTGSLVIDDQRVTFTRLRASMAGARAVLSGQIDLRSAAAGGRVRVGMQGLSLAALPGKWTIPQGLSGTVSSQFELAWAASHAGVSVRGGGEGTLADARLMGLDFRPIQVRWQLTEGQSRADATTHATATPELALNLATAGTPLANLLSAARIDPKSLGIEGRERIAASGHLRIPLATVADPQTYQGGIRLVLVQPSGAERRVRSATANMTWDATTTFATELDVALADTGRIHAQAATVSGGKGRVRGRIVCGHLPVAVASRWLDLPVAEASGNWSAEADWSVPLPRWREPDAWHGRGRLTVAKARIRGESIAEVVAELTVDQGRLTATATRALWRGSSIEGTGTLDLKKPYRFAAQLRSHALRLNQALAIAQPSWLRNVPGTMAIDARVGGSLRPPTWQASGQGEIAKLVIAQLPIAGPKFRWQIDAKRLALTDVKAQLAEGTVALDLRLPWDEASTSTLAGRFDRLQVHHITDRLGPLPVTVTGPASGDFTISDLTGKTTTAKVHFTAGAAVLRQVAVERIEGQATYREGKVQMEIRGRALDGGVLLQGTVTRAPAAGDAGDAATDASDHLKPAAGPLAAGNLAGQLRFDGQVTLQAGRLERLNKLYKRQLVPRPLTGAVDIQLDLKVAGPPRAKAVTGWVELRDVRWDGTRLLQQVKGRIVLAEDQLRLSDVETRMVAGRASAELSFARAAGNVGSFAVHLERVQIQRLLAPWPQLGRRVQGNIDLSVDGRLGHLWRGAGELRMRGGQIAGVPMRASRVPFRWYFEPQRGIGHLVVRGASVRPVRGRVAVDMQLDWGQRMAIDATAQARAIDIRDLAAGLPTVQERVTGLVNGQLTLVGRNVRSFDDLAGTFNASVGQGHVFSLPVFNQLLTALVVGQVLSPGVETSVVKGRFARGTISVDQMTLVASGLQLLIKGDITAAGRLDLDATADTGQVTAATAACRLAVNPAGYLFRRLMFFHVGGTVRTPVVQIRPAEQLDRELLRFFLL